MCRFLAYRGEPVFLSSLIYAPAHSLVHQSLYAQEAKTGTNGDGFGLGWYSERPEPGVFREIRPAWSDENLRSLCQQVRSGLFLAHVRASTGTASTRANCHPFVHGRHLFMHNGQVGGYDKLKRRIEAMIPDELYDSRLGTTDSEALFLAALGRGLDRDPLGAVSRTLREVRSMMSGAAITEPLRFTAAYADGESLYAFRWACDASPPSLYYRDGTSGLTVVSEPLDGRGEGWREVPKGCALIARPGQPLVIERMDCSVARAAA